LLAVSGALKSIINSCFRQSFFLVGPEIYRLYI